MPVKAIISHPQNGGGQRQSITIQHIWRKLKETGKAAKLLREKALSRIIGSQPFPHRYPPFIQRIPTVDIIAGERVGAKGRLLLWVTVVGRAGHFGIFWGREIRESTVPVLRAWRQERRRLCGFRQEPSQRQRCQDRCHRTGDLKVWVVEQKSVWVGKQALGSIRGSQRGLRLRIKPSAKRFRYGLGRVSRCGSWRCSGILQ